MVPGKGRPWLFPSFLPPQGHRFRDPWNTGVLLAALLASSPAHGQQQVAVSFVSHTSSFSTSQNSHIYPLFIFKKKWKKGDPYSILNPFALGAGE